MKLIRNLSQNVIYVGGEDPKIKLFEHTLPIEKGVTYNSYLILDEKTCLRDTCDQDISKQFIENVEGALNGRKLDYLVIHHREPDHGYNISEILLRHPETQLVGNSKTFLFLHQFSPLLNTQGKETVVKEGDALSLGSHTLRFYLAPRVHWPEVMRSFEEKEGLLFTADAFGRFDTLDGKLFADEFSFEKDILPSARAYYANIVGKYGPSVLALRKKLPIEKVKRILPLHGPIVRDPATRKLRIGKYAEWASYTSEKKGVRIAYSTRYGDRQNAAYYLAGKLNERGLKELAVFDVSEASHVKRLAKAFEYSNIVLLGNTYNRSLFPQREAFIKDRVRSNLNKRTLTLIENGTWAPCAARLRKELLSPLKTLSYTKTSLTIHSSRTEEDSKSLDFIAGEILSTLE